jgi:multiple sugar transport system permease protein
LLTLPALAVLAVTMLYPVAWTVWLSLNGPATASERQSRLQGLGNYVRIAAAPEFRAALVQTLEIVAASFVLEAVLGLTIALALHRGLRGSKVMSAIVRCR